MRRGVAWAAGVACVLLSGSAAAQQPPSGTIVVPPPGQPPPADGQPAQPAQPAPAQPAQPAPPPKRKEAKPEKEWYGWQILAADAGAAVLMIAGQATQVYSIFDVGLGAYFLAPPVVHVVHNNAGPAFGSLGLRLVAPWVGVAIGVTVGLFFLSGTDRDPNKCHVTLVGGSTDCTNTALTDHDYVTQETLLFHSDWARPLGWGFNIGLVSGYLLAIGIDAGLIAYEKVDDSEYGKLTTPPKSKWYTVAPSLTLDKHNAGLGLRGTF